MVRKAAKGAGQLAKRIADAVDAGDTELALELTRRLEQQLSGRPDAKHAAAGPSRSDLTLAFAAPPAVVRVERAHRTAGSARQTVVAALAEIGVPARARLISDYAEARFGERIETRAYAALRRDERRAWGSNSPRPTYIVPALEGRFFQPIRGLLAVSDWPLESRLIGPWSERADHLAATVQLARQLAWLDDRDPEVARRLAPIVAGMARSMPGALEAGEIDTARVESAAEAEREALCARDDPWRKEAAARAREQLDAEQQLWGVHMGVVAGSDR